MFYSIIKLSLLLRTSLARSLFTLCILAHTTSSLAQQPVDLSPSVSGNAVASPIVLMSKSPAEAAINSRESQLDLTVPKTAQVVQDRLDIATAVKLAVNNYPSVKEAIGRLYEQTEQVDVAKSGYYPQVGAGISNGYRSSTGRSEQAFTVSASQMIYDFGKVASLVNIAEFGVDRNYAVVLKAVDDLVRDTGLAFIEVQRYESLLDIAAKQIVAISELEALAQKRVEMGASSRSDELQAHSRVENAIALKLQLNAELDVWKRTLQDFLGTNRQASTQLDFPAYLYEACSAGTDDFTKVPEIMIAEADRAEAIAAIERSETEFYPTVSLDANLDYFANRADTNSTLSDQDVSATINVKSSLYQGGAMSARKRSAEYALRAVVAAKDTAYLDVTRRLSDAKDKTRNFHARLNNLDARYDTIVKTQALYRIQYLSLGTRTLLDILNTEQEIHQAMFDQQNTRHDLRRLQIDCLHSIGGLREAFIIDEQVDLQP